MNAPSFRKQALLKAEVELVQSFLDGFEAAANNERRLARISDNGEYMFVRNFPLPDRFSPDYIDLLVLLDDFPARPPIGIYVLHKQNGTLIEQISRHFNAFRDKAFHNAPAIRDFTWICYSYAGNAWRYRQDSPARGDNTAKFLAGFFAEMSK